MKTFAVFGVCVAASLPACTAATDAEQQQLPTAMGAMQPGGAGAGDGAAGAAGTGGGGGFVDPVMPGAVDPGRVGIHRLNNTEYNNTVRDLLGTALQPAATFLAEEGLHFDNTAASLGMTPTQFEAYLEAASTLMTEALANEGQRVRFLTCTPTIAADPCARSIIETFGKQIYRRPLDETEVIRALAVYDADLARSQNGTEAIGLALQAMLSGASFLYRIEYDPDPASIVPHPLSAHELASRLSYLHWSSMPDATLLAAADTGELLAAASLETTVDRLLADPKSQSFVESFAGQWLDLRKLISHSVTAQVFPTYSGALADAMMAEGYLWFSEFLHGERPISDWFTADFHYVNDALAAHYGFQPPGTAELVRVEVTDDQRRGFLGLASFLTHTSFPSRTSPTLRGTWVLSDLLCSVPPPPPGNVPDLEESAQPDEATEPTGSENVRERLDRHRTDPACSACHALLDPIGLGLEQFDGIGRYRETYDNGDPIDPQGTLPSGASFSGAAELAAILPQDPRFTQCVAKKFLTYALGRELEGYDVPSLDRLAMAWAGRGLTLRNLLKEIVLADAFRLRRGETE